MKIGRRHFCALVLLASFSLAGCAAFPSTGPSASRLAREAVKLETVSPEVAATMRQHVEENGRQRVKKVLANLMQNRDAVDVRLYPGAKLDVTLWTQPLVNDSVNGVGAIAKNDLGSFTVANNGTLTLPYVGAVGLAGQDLRQAQQELSAKFAALRMFQAPQVTLSLQNNTRQQIIVSGMANHPTVLNWREGGVTLAEAITRAGGSVLYGQGQMQGQPLSANHVTIVRKGVSYDLPVRAALESDIQLRPNDQVLLEHKPVVRVQCLGGGWAHDTVQAFDDVPTLTKVVASGGGLNGQTAQGTSVFVLSPDRSVIYQFKWNTLAGLQAAQNFPVRNGSVIYIATAPIVRIQQITSVLFSAAYPISTAKGL